MKLENNMQLIIASMGKLFKVTHICNSIKEANQIMSDNSDNPDPEISCITEDEQGRIYLVETLPLHDFS